MRLPCINHIFTAEVLNKIAKILGYPNHSLGASDYAYLKNTLTHIDRT